MFKGEGETPLLLRNRGLQSIMWRWWLSLFLLYLLGQPVPSCAGSPVSVSATAMVVSKNQCKFKLEPGVKNLALDFNDLDPTTLSYVFSVAKVEFECKGKDKTATYYISANDGENPSGTQKRMQNSEIPGSFLPYKLSLSHTIGSINTNTPQTLTLTGEIWGDNYQYAIAGSYTDSVIITIEP